MHTADPLGEDLGDLNIQDAIYVCHGKSVQADIIKYIELMHTTTADIENHVILLRIKPLHDLGSQLGDERSRILVGLASPVVIS